MHYLETYTQKSLTPRPCTCRPLRTPLRGGDITTLRPFPGLFASLMQHNGMDKVRWAMEAASVGAKWDVLEMEQGSGRARLSLQVNGVFPVLHDGIVVIDGGLCEVRELDSQVNECHDLVMRPS